MRIQCALNSHEFSYVANLFAPHGQGPGTHPLTHRYSECLPPKERGLAPSLRGACTLSFEPPLLFVAERRPLTVDGPSFRERGLAPSLRGACPPRERGLAPSLRGACPLSRNLSMTCQSTHTRKASPKYGYPRPPCSRSSPRHCRYGISPISVHQLVI